MRLIFLWQWTQLCIASLVIRAGVFLVTQVQLLPQSCLVSGVGCFHEPVLPQEVREQWSELRMVYYLFLFSCPVGPQHLRPFAQQFKDFVSEGEVQQDFSSFLITVHVPFPEA